MIHCSSSFSWRMMMMVLLTGNAPGLCRFNHRLQQ